MKKRPKPSPRSTNKPDVKKAKSAKRPAAPPRPKLVIAPVRAKAAAASPPPPTGKSKAKRVAPKKSAGAAANNPLPLPRSKASPSSDRRPRPAREIDPDDDDERPDDNESSPGTGKRASPPDEGHRKVRSHLSTKELREFKELLLEKRSELAGDVRRLTSEALHRGAEGERDHGVMPIHMADLGSDNWEQDFTLGLLANEEAVVREIDEALARIEDRTYGICIATYKPIEKARLLAKPWAKYCIEHARLREEGRAR